MSEGVRPKAKYKTNNWAAYNATLKARGRLTIWLDKDMQCLAIPNGKRGRQRSCHTVLPEHQVPFGLALRQRQDLDLLESLLRMAGLDWPVPDFSTISRRQQTLKEHLAIEVTDSSGDSTAQECQAVTGQAHGQPGTHKATETPATT